MALDWLYADLPSNALSHLEVYTFGCAGTPVDIFSRAHIKEQLYVANHFNNPIRSRGHIDDRQGKNENPIDAHINDKSFLAEPTKVFFASSTIGRQESDERVIPHIEHYANSEDPVSRFGVLNFTRSSKHHDTRFMGRVFEQMGVQGHQFNQHYLDTMFPIDRHTGVVLDRNAFMDAECTVNENLVISRERAAVDDVGRMVGLRGRHRTISGEYQGTRDLEEKYVGAMKANVAKVKSMRVRELSRLWLYTNGKAPEDN
jgi:hypothetical protein